MQNRRHVIMPDSSRTPSFERTSFGKVSMVQRLALTTSVVVFSRDASILSLQVVTISVSWPCDLRRRSLSRKNSPVRPRVTGLCLVVGWCWVSICGPDADVALKLECIFLGLDLSISLFEFALLSDMNKPSWGHAPLLKAGSK